MVVKTFDSLDSFTIFIANDISSDSNVQNMLYVIENHFSWLPETVKNLETRYIALNVAIIDI